MAFPYPGTYTTGAYNPQGTLFTKQMIVESDTKDILQLIPAIVTLIRAVFVGPAKVKPAPKMLICVFIASNPIKE